MFEAAGGWNSCCKNGRGSVQCMFARSMLRAAWERRGVEEMPQQRCWRRNEGGWLAEKIAGM